MNIILNIDNIDINSIIFYKPVTNKDKKYDKFYKILYNCNLYTINNIIINIPIFEIDFVDNKYRLNHKYRKKIKNMEYNILNKLNLFHKFRLILNLSTNHLQIKNNQLVYLKIYGIWNNKNDIGLIYKYLTY